MAGYNFLDPNQEQEYLEKASKAGLDLSGARAYINNKKKEQISSQKLGLDLQKQQVEGMKLQKDLLDLTSGTSGKQLGETNITSISDVTASIQSLNNLTKSMEARKGLMGPIKGRLTGINPYMSEAQDLQGEIDSVRQLVGKALEGGVLRKEDEEKYKKILPKLSDTPTVARMKIDNVMNLLNQKQESLTQTLQGSGYDVSGIQSTTASPGLDTYQVDAPPDTNPAISSKGDIASYGDIITGPDGSLQIYGDPTTENSVLKLTRDGNKVENKLIQYLADSNLLPMAGGIVGGLTGGIIGGAAGAATGAAAKQALSEILDPDKQNLSDHARVIVTEGIVDAVFSGMTLGIGKVGKAGIGLLLKKVGSKPISEGLEAGAKSLSKEALEAGGKKLPILGSQEDLIRKAYKLSSSQKAEFQDVYGKSFYNKLIEFLDGDVSKLTKPKLAVELSEEGIKTAGKEIEEKIAGRAVKAEKVIPQVEDLIKGLSKPSLVGDKVVDVIPSEYGAGVARLTEKIGILKGYAKQNNGFIPLEEVQSMKISLNNAFKGVAEEVSSKTLLKSGRKSLMSVIEQYGGEGIKESNLKYHVYDLLKDSAVKADEKVVTAAFDAMDIISGGGAAMASGGNIPVSVATFSFMKFLRSLGKDPYVQLGVVNKLGRYAVEKQNKNAVRGLVMAVQKLGYPMGLGENVIKTAGKIATESTLSPENTSSPGIDIQGGQEQTEDLMPKYLYR